MLARLQHGRDQGVNGGIFCAHVVSRALVIRGLASPIERLLVARRQRLVPAILDHVEFEPQPALIELDGIDRADRSFDAGALKIAHICQRDALLIACRHQNFEGKGRLGRSLPQHRAVQIVAGFR